jgi:hypothetical protein
VGYIDGEAVSEAIGDEAVELADAAATPPAEISDEIIERNDSL